MSYLSRLYNHRNSQSPETKSEKPFFSKRNDDKSASKNSFFQAKLAVNEPGDSYEKEADAVASAVVNRSSKNQILQHNRISSIQRLATAPEEEKVSSNDQRMERDKEKPFQLQKKSADEEKIKEDEQMKKTTPVQTKHEGNSSTASPQVSSKIENSAGKGKKLPVKTLNEMNSSFGADFSNVRVHNDNESAEMNKELQAHAFTHGSDIYFNSGKYHPENADGKFLLAHELTHVMQQGKVPNMIHRQAAPALIPAPQLPPPQLVLIQGGADEVAAATQTAEVMAESEGLTFAEALTTSGESLLALEAGGGLEVEASTGPPGWVVGIVILASAGAMIGLGYLLHTSSLPRPQAQPVPKTKDENFGCDEAIASGEVQHECWQLDDLGYDRYGSGDDYFKFLKNKYPELQKTNPNERTTDGPCPGIGTHTNVQDGDGERFGSIVCCPCCLQEEGVSLTMKCGLV